MSAAEIVDPTRSPASSRQKVLQFLGPIVGVLLVIAAIIAISLHNYRTTRQGAIALSSDLLRSQQKYVTEEVRNYLSPASDSASIAPDMFGSPLTDASPDSFMLYGRSMLAHTPQVDSFYLASDQGQFWMVTRHGKDYEQTHFQVENGHEVYRHTYVDQNGTYLGTAFDPADKYDVTARPWFQGAIKRIGRGDGALYWTNPYAYLAAREFTITASIAFPMKDGHHAVFATNISLNRLTSFLNELQVGRSGRAVIVDMKGQIIAGHNMGEDGAEPSFDPAHMQLDPKTQPVFIRALNTFRVKGPGPGLVTARNKNYVTIAATLPFVHRRWVLLLNAPENDFSDFAVTARRQNLWFSALVVGLASLLALGLIIQGRRIERLRKRLEVGREQMRAENASLYEIASTPDLFEASHDVPILTEALAARTGSRRASLWRLLPDGERLLCEDAFDPVRDVHSTGIEITKREHSKLFDALMEGHSLFIEDARQDERSQNFQRIIMRSVEAKSLVFHPVMRGHQAVGVIVLEDPSRADAMEHIVAIVSSVVALRFSQALDQGDQQAGARPSVSHELKDTRYDEGFLLPPGSGVQDGVVPSGIYPQVPVMVISFADPYAMDSHSAERAMKVVSSLSEDIQRIARETGLFSVQVVSNRLVLVGGCSQEPDPGAVLRLADAAVSIREACLSLLASVDIDPVFRVGIDVGPVMAAMLGKEPSVFNLWGEAINVAELLAASAPDAGTIQVSEQAYLQLREHFLFRARGMFYLPNSGVTRSFILAGRR
ncbi:MAG: adenylate/guanylate cyclase domain-containing protein [Gluconobacter cerinus]|uniref:adenylate/guanylate cyclase domain-containing protein n=1 Tax=Gluconobacter cerinus TaxID=38307 RepID=UPI0039EC1276